ncbi:MAG: TIGR03790 family protein, partial [Myxococcota bacterium]|nr:TIGR03790 family protein [Myxococcota bacterium]
MPVRLTLSTLALAMLLACGGHPVDRVCIVVNQASPVSLAIGQAYARAREIPDDQIVHLDIPLADPALGDRRHESIGRADFERLVRQPLERIFEERDWVDEMEVIVTTKGIPLRIEGPKVSTLFLLRDDTAASVDAELSLLFSSLIGSPGVATSANPYFGRTISFRDFRAQHPGSPLRYMVARITGFQTPTEPGSALPRDVERLLANGQAEPAARALWLIDLDPALPGPIEVANDLLLASAVGSLDSLGMRLVVHEGEGFAGDFEAIQGYASWGSNASRDALPGAYGEAGDRVYPGRFAPRALATDLVSTNGRSFTAPPRYGQSLVADLIALGVGGATAHVAEPTLPGVARPQILLSQYAQGVRAIEAYYRALPYLGWMNIYVGDPLMQLAAPPAEEFPMDSDGDGQLDWRDNCRL